jgi:hypothetical protein
LAEARRAFEEEILPRVSDHQANEGRRFLQEAEAKAQEQASKRVTSLEQEFRSIRDDALRKLTEVRDDYEALAAEGSSGRISAQDYQARLQDLRRQQQAAEGRLEDAEKLVDQAEAIEGDPIAYYDDLTRRMNMLQEWPW